MPNNYVIIVCTHSLALALLLLGLSCLLQMPYTDMVDGHPLVPLADMQIPTGIGKLALSIIIRITYFGSLSRKPASLVWTLAFHQPDIHSWAHLGAVSLSV